jgi:outer membrane protein insertion porin family
VKRFDLVILDKLTEDLKNFYLAHGFWDIKLDDKKFIKNPDTDAYTILLFINKGKQRLWGGLSIKGFKELEQNNFLKKYVIFSDQQVVPFDPRWVSEQRAFLLDYFHKQGYWYVDIQPDIQLQPLPPLFIGKIQQERVRCVLTWNIMLGEKVSFGKIFLRGDTKVPFKTILNELKFKEGDFLNKEKIDLTRKKLKRLDVFKTVRIQPYQLTKSKSKKPIAITLVDDDPLELRLRAGFFLTSKNFMFKRQSTPKAGASFIIRNPISSADKLAIDADWTLFERMINVDYQRPSFFSYPFMSKFKGYAGKYIHPVRVGSSDSAYESLQSGLLVGLSDEYKNDYHWGINLGNEWLKTCRIRGYLKLDDTMINIAVPYLFLEPTLVIDKLDDRINTRKGSLSVMSLKMMVPEDRGIVTARLMAEQSFFYPFYKNIIGAFHVRLGYIFRRQFNQIMPIERFYLGGPNSVRGYEIESLPPLGVTITAKNNDLIYKKEFTCQDDRIVKEKEKELLTELSISHPGTNFNVTQDYTIQGGSSMINGSFELRIPIFSPLGFVVFQDIGVLSQSGLAGFKGIWYPTSGFGFRYKTPIGAIRFDIGWKWKHRFTSDHSHPYAWYLTIGESF